MNHAHFTLCARKRHLANRQGIALAVLVLLAMFTLANCSGRGQSPLPTPVAFGHNASAESPTAVLEVRPSSGYAGTYTNVQGEGWPPATVVNIRLADVQGHSPVLVSITTDTGGRFSTGFLYPANARWLQPGQRIVIAASESETTTAVALFTVSPPEGVQIPPPPPGLTETVPVTVPAQATVMPTRASTQTRILMPIVARTGITPSPVNVDINIDPLSGGENTPVTVYGSGLAGNSRVRVYLTEVAHTHDPGRGRHLYIEAVSDASGNYSAVFTVPSAWSDGAPLSSGDLAFVIASTDQTVWASATFNFLAAAPPTTPPLTPAPQLARMIEVAIDVEPERINLRGNGVVRVTVEAPEADGAALSEGFDLAAIDSNSVRFGRRSDVLEGTGGAGQIRDEMGRRGRQFRFRARETGLATEDDEACLHGVWMDAQGNTQRFFGCNSVRIRGDRA